MESERIPLNLLNTLNMYDKGRAVKRDIKEIGISSIILK